jgi:nucleoside-diphosphate-sugar epimerase
MSHSSSGNPPARRVLVTGATGFIGRHALPALRRRGFDVHAVSSRSRESNELTTWHFADLLDCDVADGLVERIEPTHLLHLAWYTEPGQFWTASVNVQWLETSLRLMRAFAAAGGQRVVVAGTCAEYDWSVAAICREFATPLGPRTLYGQCKRSLHAVTRCLYRTPGSPSLAWGRIFFMYGPHEHPSRLVSSVARALLAGREAQCSAGHQQRDFMHCADVADAFVALLDSEVEGPVNIGSGEPVSIAEVVSLVGDACGRPELVRLGALPAREGDPATLVADVTRLRDEVDFVAGRSLRDGIEQTIEWWREHVAS